jgi:hypothetical protein
MELHGIYPNKKFKKARYATWVSEKNAERSETRYKCEICVKLEINQVRCDKYNVTGQEKESLEMGKSNIICNEDI